MTDDIGRLHEMERAYARGDHEIARKLAHSLTASPSEDVRSRAVRLLTQTEPDPFINAVALVGLGLMAYLVYNYVL